MLLLYKSLVRSHLEHDLGTTLKDQKALEKAQRRGTKLITSIKYLPYEHRLQGLNLPSLDEGQIRFKFIK